MISNIEISGDDVKRIIFDRLSPALEGEQLAPSIYALLTFAIMHMKPNISFEELTDSVVSAADHIITLVSTPEGEPN